MEHIYNATSEHSVEVLKRGIASNVKPREMLTGRDTQFYVNEAKDKEQGKTIFQIFLKEQGIKHIIGRVNHPQTNGKRERFFVLGLIHIELGIASSKHFSGFSIVFYTFL